MRKIYVIEAENGIGLYLSKYLANNALDYLKSFDRRVQVYDDYEAAKSYVFRKYQYDDEMNLETFRPNFTIMRDKSQRYNFCVQSKCVIGYGTDIGMRYAFQSMFHLHDDDIIETETTEEAEFYARRGFVDVYGDSRLYFDGILNPGESISFVELLNRNGFENFVDILPKFFGVRR